MSRPRRFSADTVKHLRSSAARFEEQGRVEVADSWTEIALELDAARSQGEPLWRQENDRPSGQSAAGPIDSDFHTPVYVINWGLCASACLDANDYFTRFDNVKLIGAPTSADSTYMEVRSADLPSGAARIVIPTKIWVGRQRGWGEVYEPDISMTDLDWSTANFLDWIERDLL